LTNLVRNKRWLKKGVFQGGILAIVRKLSRIQLEKDTKHTEVNCTYSVVESEDGKRYLQIDTYGSSSRKIPNKKSQSIRFSPEAIHQLKQIIEAELHLE